MALNETTDQTSATASEAPVAGSGSSQNRPWLKSFGPNIPAELTCEYETALEMFRASIAAAPDRAMMHYFDSTVSAGEVDELTDALAVGFADLGVRFGDRVAVYLQNVPQFVLVTLAAWKLGAIVVAVNPMNRSREVETLLNDSRAQLLVTLESLYADVADTVRDRTPVETVVTTSELDFLDSVPPALADVQRTRFDGVDDLLELAARHVGRRPADIHLGPDDVAFLSYTSGTTGPPKGAMNTHRNVVFQSTAYSTWIGLTDKDVVYALAPLFHITGLICHIGVCLRVASPLVLGYRFSTATTANLIQQWGATFIAGATTAFTALMNDSTVRREQLQSVTRVVCGGAPLSPSTTDAFEERFGLYLHNAYGMTETTAATHVTPIGTRAPVDKNTGALSVGVPIFNTAASVLGDDGQHLPAGEVGEFAIESPGVVAGYWEKPEETAHALAGGIVRTGDVGFMDADGWFYLLDRKKEMIIASGFKVWPREVEDVLYSFPAVHEAAVIGVPDPYRGETVKAFVSLKAGATAEPAELIEYCKTQMAAYKYPRSVEIVDDLPKTTTGKILRRVLRDQETTKQA